MLYPPRGNDSYKVHDLKLQGTTRDSPPVRTGQRINAHRQGEKKWETLNGPDIQNQT